MLYLLAPGKVSMMGTNDAKPSMSKDMKPCGRMAKVPPQARLSRSAAHIKATVLPCLQSKNLNWVKIIDILSCFFPCTMNIHDCSEQEPLQAYSLIHINPNRGGQS